MNLLKHFPRLAAAALFAATASTAVVVADATHAGAPAQGILAAAPQRADAAVVVGVGYGPYRYYRWAYRGGSWVRLGFYYGSAPGYIPGGYYVGYGPPAFYGPRYYGYHPFYGYYGHPYWGHPYWGHPYWGGGPNIHVGIRI